MSSPDFARLLLPRLITDARFVASSVPEPDPAALEVAWASGASTSLGQRRTRASTHRIYRDTLGGASTTPPEDDAARWLDDGPTNRWAWADYYESTTTAAASPYTLRVRPGVFDAIVFRGLDAATVRVQCYATPGGALYHDKTYAVDGYLTGDLMWEFYFGDPRPRPYLMIDALPLNPEAEVLITIAGLDAAPVRVGTIAFGSWEPLGLPEFAFDADLIDRSRIEEEPVTGRMRIRRGVPSANISGTCILEADQASRAADVLSQFLGVPVAVSISSSARYDYLNVFGLISATVSAVNPVQAALRLRVRGIS